VKTNVNSGGVYPQPSHKKGGFQWDGKLGGYGNNYYLGQFDTNYIIFSEMLKI
jgi:hypothetical protein